jgi:CMP-N-acetylneuraminic acid synthetase
MPNCPLRVSKDILASYKIIKNTKANCLISVVDYHWLYPFWAMQERNKRLDFFFGKKYLIDSKNLPQNIYCPSGAVRWVKVNNFLREKKFYGKSLVKYEIPFERGVDIDTYKDFELAKNFYKFTKI